MIIQNFEELAVTDKKKDCLEILEAGLQAANPQNILPHYVTPNEIKINGKVSLFKSNFAKNGILTIDKSVVSENFM